MSTAPTWTKPYFGVQHLNEVKKGAQASVSDYGGFATGFVKIYGGTHVDSGVLPDAASARAWCEATAKNMGLLS